MIDPTATHPLLRELNDALAIEGAEPVDWIVCGGTALGILGLVQRPTRDVDVITIPDRNHQLRAELREFLQELGHEDLAYYIA